MEALVKALGPIGMVRYLRNMIMVVQAIILLRIMSSQNGQLMIY